MSELELAEEIELWTIADDNSKDAIEEMAEQLGETPEWVKEYMNKDNFGRYT